MPYLILDVESHPDVDRVIESEDGKARQSPTNPDVLETRQEVCDRILAGLCKDAGCMPPTRFHVPDVVVMLLVDDNLTYMQHAVSESPDWKVNVNTFWSTYAWCSANAPGTTLVGFNSSKFDLPNLELNGLALGLDLSQWFRFGGPNYQDPRSRFAPQLHLDLYYYLNNGGSIGGSLNFWSRLAGLPGKLDTSGSIVTELLKVQSGRRRIADYCCTDVINTYGLLYQLLFSMRRVRNDWRCDNFNATMDKVFAGRGEECAKFANIVRAGGLF